MTRQDQQTKSVIWLDVLSLFISRHLSKKYKYTLGSRKDCDMPDMSWYYAILRKDHDFNLVWQNNNTQFFSVTRQQVVLSLVKVSKNCELICIY